MSIDVDIIPTACATISWNSIKQILFTSQLADESRRLLGNNPLLIEQRTNRVIGDAEVLEPASYYYFGLQSNNTLRLGIERNSETYTNEIEFLDDFGQTLGEHKKGELARVWKSIGVSYNVSSMAGRNRDEPGLFVAISTAIAELTNGFILVKDNDVFDLPVGCYPPSEFKRAEPRFFLEK